MDIPGNVWLDASKPFGGETRISWRNSTSSLLSFSPRGKLLLEVVMVLMCVGAVTGAVVYFFLNYLKYL